MFRPARVLSDPKWMFVVAFVIRAIVVCAMYTEHLAPSRNHWQFGWEMGQVAHSLYSGHGFSAPLPNTSGPTAEVMQIYPSLLAVCMRLFGGFTSAAAIAILLLNALFASLTVFPVRRLAQKLFGNGLASAAGWTWALYPYSIFLTTRIWENTLTCLIATWIWVLTLELETTTRRRDWMIWGALWGVVALTSPALLSTLPFVFAWLLWRRRLLQIPSGGGALCAALLCCAIVAPWLIRNERVFGRLMLRDNLWLELHVGNNGDYKTIEPWASAHPSENAAEFAQWQQFGELGYMDAKRQQTLGYISTHLETTAIMTARRVLYFWTGFWGPSDPEWISDMPSVALNVCMTLLMLFALKSGAKHAPSAIQPLVIALATFPIVYYISHPRINFRHPIDPIIVTFSCYGAVQFWASISARYRAVREHRIESTYATQRSGD